MFVTNIVHDFKFISDCGEYYFTLKEFVNM